MLWAVGASHSTATLSSGGTRGLYGLRLMHRLNIFLSCFGPRAGQAIFFCSFAVLTLTLGYVGGTLMPSCFIGYECFYVRNYIDLKQ